MERGSIDAITASDARRAERSVEELKERVCSVCGEKSKEGLLIQRIDEKIFPPSPSFVCNKCEHVMKMLILSHRRVKI